MLCIVADTNDINVVQHLGKCFCDDLKLYFWGFIFSLKIRN